MNSLTITEIFSRIGPDQVVPAIQGISFLRLEVEIYVLVRETKFFIVWANPGIIAIETVEPEGAGIGAVGMTLANEFAIVSEIAIVSARD